MTRWKAALAAIFELVVCCAFVAFLVPVAFLVFYSPETGIPIFVLF